MQKVKVVMGTPKDANEEVLFAAGRQDGIETQNMRVTYALLSKFTNPTARYPQIRKIHGNGTVTELGLTPAEGRWLAKVLTEMFADSQPTEGK